MTGPNNANVTPEAIRELVDQGLSDRQIGDRLGVSVFVAMDWRKKFGIYPVPHRAQGRRHHRGHVPRAGG